LDINKFNYDDPHFEQNCNCNWDNLKSKSIEKSDKRIEILSSSTESSTKNKDKKFPGEN